MIGPEALVACALSLAGMRMPSTAAEAGEADPPVVAAVIDALLPLDRVP
jgi:hypothetical protein